MCLSEFPEVSGRPSALPRAEEAPLKKPRLTLAEAIMAAIRNSYVPPWLEGECGILVRALQTIGTLPPDLDDNDSYTAEQRHVLPYFGHTVEKLYPWLKQKLLCPWCADEIEGKYIVEHPFLEHVRTSEATIHHLCEWLQKMEEEVDPPVSETIVFQTADEREAVLWAARRQKLPLNAFLAAALRLAIEQRLVLTEFARADPEPTRR
jgi:hypothetical protein